MANLSNYIELALINHVLRSVTYADPAAVYCGIVSDTATDADMEAGILTNEITGYTGNRPAITFKAPVDVGGKSTCKNDPALEFLVMPAPAGRQVKYAIVCDAATAGNITYWCPLAVPKTWNAGDTFRVPVDALVCDLA
jgi:hypothetical protein